MTARRQSLYFESTVTVAPIINASRVLAFGTICAEHGFRIADMLTRRQKPAPGSGEIGSLDSVERLDEHATCTGYDPHFETLSVRTADLGHALRAAEFEVRRYKIKEGVLDSKLGDDLGIVS